MIDWQTPEAAHVDNDWVGIGLKGLFFDNRIGEEEPTSVIPSMPLKDTSHPEMFQNFISSYTINGFFNSLTEVMDVKGWIHAE